MVEHNTCQEQNGELATYTVCGFVVVVVVFVVMVPSSASRNNPMESSILYILSAS